jgi:hypothetical protein
MKGTTPPSNSNANLSRREFVKQIGGAAVIAAQSVSPPFCFAGSGGSIKAGPLSIAAKSGRPLRISNAATGSEYHLDEWRFEIQLDDVLLKLETAQKVSVESSANSVRVLYDYPSHEVLHTVQSGPIAGFAESVLKVRHKAGKGIYVRRVTCGEFRFSKSFDESILHTDGSILETPVNLFLRAQEGGVILGLAYPYQELLRHQDGKTFQLGYQVEAATPAGTEFDTEPLFVGTYACTGLGIYKPFEKVAYRFITPDPEERDLGEIWTMQEYVRTKVPYHPIRDTNQFLTFLNSWWAGLSLDKLAPAIDLMATLGVPDVGTRESYFGIVDHISATKDLENLPDGYRIPLPEETKRMIAYGRTKGVRLISFVAPCRSFRTEWEWRSKEGKPSMYGEIRSVCFACREAAEFSLNLWDQMIKDSGTDVLGFDGRILTSFNEVDLGEEHIGPMPCYATNHGHKPGQNFYQDYKNGQYIMSELRRRNPGIFLEVYWGLKRTYPYGLAALNGCENLYESNGHQDDRMQSWYNQNYRFLPNYVNFAQIRGYNDQELRKEILSGISLSSHLQIGVGVKLLDKPANQQFFRKWTGWAGANYRFLNVKKDLFGQPWAVPLDGSAHIIEDRGYLFLFNECANDQIGSIPLNEWIGLTRGDIFDLQQIYPEEKWVARAVKRGEKINLPVAASGVSIVSVAPASVATPGLADIVWHNVGKAELQLNSQEVDISDLEGYQGQRREIAVLTNDLAPKRLSVNGQGVPCLARKNMVLAEVQFGEPPLLQPASLQELWPVQGATSDSSGAIVIEGTEPVKSVRTAGSGTYEIDMVCDFNEGGFFFRADPEGERGLMAAALLSSFPPLDGNIGFWDASFQQFPITLTLGKTLKKSQHYRFRIESYGDRHSFSVLEPVSGKVLVEPLSYRVDTIEPDGIFGIHLKDGKARITRFAFAPSQITRQIRPLKVKPEDFLQEAFTSRQVTRKLGQRTPAAAKKVVGRDTAVQFDYLKEQEKMWSAK